MAKDAVNLKSIKLYQPNAKRSFYSVQKIAELCEFAIDNFSSMKNNIFNVGSESGNVSKLEMINIIKKTVDFDLEIIEGKDRDTRDYNVNYDKLKSCWPNLNENFEEQLKSVTEYYKRCQTKN
jgi:nucleoside-diphosphate-sugar epimerase